MNTATKRVEGIETFLAAYIECALWSSNDESDESGGEPLDANYSADDLAPEAYTQMRADCEAFLAKAFEIGLQGLEHDLECAGHDFWLTRNGHGAGFWDGDWGDQGDALTKLAETFRHVDLYIGDDNKIHAM